MMLPSDAKLIVQLMINRARDLAARVEPTTGAAEAAAVIESFGRRLLDLAAGYAGGRLDLPTFTRAIESEREALGFTLAAIANDQRKLLVSRLFHAGFEFLSNLLR
jgi:hypothetical protein